MTLLQGATNSGWWDEATLYQIYVRSFANSNADGIGDLNGTRQHLDHIEWLGVDGVWLGPVYPSPMIDGGYAAANTMGIDPRFGDLTTFDALVDDLHRRGLRLIGDVIPNHLSNQHPWFREALTGGPCHPARQRFYSHPCAQPPNDWPSLFSGPAWTATGDGSQISWTMENHDRVRAATRWGSAEAAAGLCAFIAGLGGVLWLYQGQELALEQVDVHVDDPQIRRGLPQPRRLPSTPAMGARHPHPPHMAKPLRRSAT